jgi:plastocyanin
MGPPLAALALLGGCAHTETVGNARTLYVALSEYRLTPQSVRVSAGPVTVFVHNYGRLTHNLVISRSGQVTGTTRPIWPGQSAEITLTLARGTYLMASTILSDEALGEYGTLTVTS